MEEVESIKIVHSVEIPVVYSLYQDEWSLRSETFGSDNQLKVIGYNGEPNPRRYYILECSVCSLDPELFGDGYFRSKKGNLLSGHTPCGCANNPGWSTFQYSVKSQRKAEELGYEFIDFYGEFKGLRTKLVLKCDLHGEWNTTIFSNFFHHEEGCPPCGKESAISLRRFTEERMTRVCLSTGQFHPETKFWRDIVDNRDANPPYWWVYCPDCDMTTQSIRSNLVRGHRPCLCSPMRQQEAYINLVTDSSGEVICVKFGVAVDTTRRVKEQNKASKYTVENYLTFTFPSVESTRKAEKLCKLSLECAYIDKESFPDGYTETTSKHNIGEIIEIYQSFGGILTNAKEAYEKRIINKMNYYEDKTNDTTS